MSESPHGIDPKACLDEYIYGSGKSKGRNPNERYASFDYCYGYFCSFYRSGNVADIANDAKLQTSCLQLGLYLASWGMMRGSSFLLERSVSYLKTLIVDISSMDPTLWKIDVDDYNTDSIALLLDCRRRIKDALGRRYNPSDTLVTKVMLGVFANVPAFDTYVTKSLEVHTMNKKSLLKVKKLYEANRDIFDTYQIYTYDFSTNEQTDLMYTKAKLVDMCCFIDGRSRSGTRATRV
jgi:hypothetical protein